MKVPGFQFPQLDREERAALTLRATEGAEGDADFVIMMMLSTMLASLGLVADSTAVVIGAMLVAPLMGPLVASGLALGQANLQLWGRALGVGLQGIGLGLFVSIVVGLFHTGFELSAEIEARSLPDPTDLAVAFVSGLAVAYAMSRKKVMQSLAGVAIAAALVPPLAVVGIALATAHWYVAGAASVLLLTNLVAIVLGAALAFRLLGISTGRTEPTAWVRRATMLLACATVLLLMPLFVNAAEKRREGLTKPLVYPLSADARQAITDYVSEWPGVGLVMQGRSSVGVLDHKGQMARIGVLVSTDEPLPAEFKSGMVQAVREARGDTAVVWVWAVRSGYEPGTSGDR